MGVGVGRATWKCENERGQMILIVVPNQLKNICNMLIHKSKTSCRNTHINASGTRKKERKKDSSIEWYIYIFFWEHHGMQALIMRWPSVGVGHTTTELAESAQTITRKTHAFVSNASKSANKIGDIRCFLFCLNQWWDCNLLFLVCQGYKRFEHSRSDLISKCTSFWYQKRLILHIGLEFLSFKVETFLICIDGRLDKINHQ